MARKPSANLKQPDMPDTVRRRDIPDADKAGMRDDKRLHGSVRRKTAACPTIRSMITTRKISAPRTTSA